MCPMHESESEYSYTNLYGGGLTDGWWWRGPLCALSRKREQGRGGVDSGRL